jgi:hypothetical protein
VIYAASSDGDRARRIVSGLILARYNAIGGAGGNFGMPVSDEFVPAPRIGRISKAAYRLRGDGGASACSHAEARGLGAAVGAGRAAAAPGDHRLPGRRHHSRLHHRQPDFTVTTANGAYA